MIPHRYRKRNNDSMKNGIGESAMCDIFTICQESEPFDISCVFRKPSGIWQQAF
jgi:hypothetical protein